MRALFYYFDVCVVIFYGLNIVVFGTRFLYVRKFLQLLYHNLFHAFYMAAVIIFYNVKRVLKSREI